MFKSLRSRMVAVLAMAGACVALSMPAQADPAALVATAAAAVVTAQAEPVTKSAAVTVAPVTASKATPYAIGGGSGCSPIGARSPGDVRPMDADGYAMAMHPRQGLVLKEAERSRL